jgi:hypothetical protein
MNRIGHPNLSRAATKLFTAGCGQAKRCAGLAGYE